MNWCKRNANSGKPVKGVFDAVASHQHGSQPVCARLSVYARLGTQLIGRIGHTFEPGLLIGRNANAASTQAASGLARSVSKSVGSGERPDAMVLRSCSGEGANPLLGGWSVSPMTCSGVTVWPNRASHHTSPRTPAAAAAQSTDANPPHHARALGDHVKRPIRTSLLAWIGQWPHVL